MKGLQLLPLLCLIAVGGCTTDAETVEQLIGTISYSELASGVNNNTGDYTIGKKLSVVTSQTQLNGIYQWYFTTDGPAIDFNTKRVIALEMGVAPGGSHTIAVNHIDEYTSYVEVTVDHTLPGSGCSITLALTTPFQFISLDDPNKPILFVERFKRGTC